jgi:hypothetical protein
MEFATIIKLGSAQTGLRFDNYRELGVNLFELRHAAPKARFERLGLNQSQLRQKTRHQRGQLACSSTHATSLTTHWLIPEV